MPPILGARPGATLGSAETKRRSRDIRIATAATIAALLAGSTPALAAPQHAAVARWKHHHPECGSPACAHSADVMWARKHRPKMVVTTFDLCVANQEEGEPGATTLSTVNWRAQGGTYGGGYSEEQSKWEAGGGLRYAPHAWLASPREQIKAFHTNGRKGEWTLHNWPTIARC